MTIRVLGIDPGSRTTGYGLIDADRGHVRYVASGCIRTIDGEMAERLRELHRSLGQILQSWQPGQVAIERIFVARNPSSAIKLGQARGVALAACMNLDVSIHEYAPRQVKLAVTGTGKAAKQQVQHMVTALLSLPGAPQADAADALAIAICHVNTRGL